MAFVLRESAPIWGLMFCTFRIFFAFWHKISQKVVIRISLNFYCWQTDGSAPTYENKKASIRWQDSATPISGYWPTSETNAGNHDFPLTGSNFGNLTAFRAIVSHIFTVHTQERPFMNFWLKFWHHHSIPWSRFPYRARYFGDMRTFSVDFCIG